MAATIETTADGVVIRIDAAVLDAADFAAHWHERTEATVSVSAASIAIEALPDEPDADAPAD